MRAGARHTMNGRRFPRRPFRMPRSFPVRHRGPPSVNVPLTVGLIGSGVTSEGDPCEGTLAFPMVFSLTVGLTGSGATSEDDCWERRPVFPTIDSLTVGLTGTGATSEGHRCRGNRVFAPISSVRTAALAAPHSRAAAARHTHAPRAPPPRCRGQKERWKINDDAALVSQRRRPCLIHGIMYSFELMCGLGALGPAPTETR